MNAGGDAVMEATGNRVALHCLEPWFDPVPTSVLDGSNLSHETPPEPAQVAPTVAVSVQATPKAEAPIPSPMEDLTAMLKRYGRTVDECMQIGRKLSLLKSSVPHGEFGPSLDKLGLSSRTAQRFMAAATRFRAYPNVRKHCFNESMLFALLPLDDVQLDELERTGCTGGLKLEDMAGMTVMQLSQSVRAVRAGVDLRHIDEGMLRLQAKLRKLDKPH